MKDKEKQIVEELANDIYSLKSCDTSFEVNCKLLAYDLITLGWEKLPEDSIIVSKEDWKENHDIAFMSGKKEGCKETAEILLNELYYIARFYYGNSANVLAWIKEKAKQLGVELKESN